MADHDTELPISLVAHAVFCERRAWLEAAGERVVHSNIEAGLAAHSVVDRPSDDRRRSTSVDISLPRLSLTGKCDVVRTSGDGTVTLVEYKSTPARRIAQVTAANVVQLALQRLCLESEGVSVLSQEVYFTNHRRAVQVELSRSDFEEARAWVAKTRKIVTSAEAPEPLVDDPRCGFCSHVSVCLPDEHERRSTARRIAVSNPSGEVLHLTTPGSRAFLRTGRLVVEKSREELASVPLERVVGLVVHGNVDVSSALIRELLWRGYSVVWCSGYGRVVGAARSAESPNGLPRVRQHVASAAGHLDLAREFVSAKASNQATQLRRNSRGEVGDAVDSIRELSRRSLFADDIPQLFGFEGDAAAIYFAHFTTMLSPGADPGFVGEWRGRTGRSATDPLNILLNYGYGLLLSDAIRAIHACGLDTHAGFLHSAVRNKPALALDLLEEFRAPVADSVVLGAINNGELTTNDLEGIVGRRRITERGRKSLTAAYRRRIQQEFTHPTFGYSVSWQRALEIQARMVLGVIDGTGTDYKGIRTR